MANNKPTIVVIGAGIIGLTSALKIQQSQPHANILLVAREWPTSIPGSPTQHSPNYASMWAGAHVRPIPITNDQLRREAGWLRRTVRELADQVQDDSSCGVTPTLGIELLEAPDAGYLALDAASFTRDTGLRGFQRLELDVPLAFRYETYCINAPVYCASLLRLFLLRGGKTKQAHLQNEAEAFTLAEKVVLVVNASGVGFGDANVFPTRGQTVVTDLSVPRTVTRQHKDGTWSFLIPRFMNGGTIVGGTKEPNDWRTEPCPDARERLVSNGVKLLSFAGQPEKKADQVAVVADVVGRRPTRHGGVRLQVEQRDAGPVVHAYGAGGRGYELSWGIADDVQGLVKQALPSSKL